MKEALTLHRLTPPDEDGLIRIEVRASNEALMAIGQGYTSSAALMAFAQSLDTFAEPIASLFRAVHGDGEVEIALKTLDGLGHIGIKVSVREGAADRENAASLWLNTQPGALMTFARRLRNVASLSSAWAELPT